MKTQLIKPCSESLDQIIIEGEIEMKESIEEIYNRLKKMKCSKIIFLPTLGTIWVSVNSVKIILFKNGKIIITRCKTRMEGERLMKFIENIQWC